MSERNSLVTRAGRDDIEQLIATPPSQVPASEPDDGPDWRRTMSAFRRHSTLFIAVIAVGIACSVYAARYWRPVYGASSKIWIAAQSEVQGRGAQLGPIRQDQLLQWDSWVDLMRSYAILDPVVHDLKLNVTPAKSSDAPLFASFSPDSSVRPDNYTLQIDAAGAYTLSGQGSEILDQGKLGDAIGQRLGFRWTPPRDSALFGRKIAFEVVTLRTASDRLAQAIDPRVDRNGAFLRVDLSGPSATQTAAIVNAIATRYVQVALDLKRRRLVEFAKNLEQQRNETQTNLDRAEKDLEQFRIRTVGLPRADDAGAQGPSSTAEPLVADGADLDRVQRERRAIASWLAATPAARSPNGPLLSDINGNPELKAALAELALKRADLRTMRYRYEDSHAAVQHLGEDIKSLSEQTVPTMVRQLDRDLATREADLTGRVAARTTALRALPPRMLEEARLTRAASEAAELNATVQQRFQEARLAQASSLPDIWVLDTAVPAQLPISDQSRRALALGIALSIGLAIGLVLMLDRVDPRVRYPAEVSRQMGLTILGAVPFLKSHRRNGPLTKDAAEEVTEALRGVRLALTHTGGNLGQQIRLTISSSGPTDGKSFITSNLGLSFAMAGFRTLMIDGDLRRGGLHRAFGVERRPGLVECLRGEIKPRDVVQPTAFPLLGIIGCGMRSRLAPELLGGPKMKDLIDTLSPDYDVILCDSPPLSAGVDPYLLATVTGQLLVVLRTGVSVRSVLAAKLEVLNRLPVRLVGAVLNAVPSGELYRPYSYHVTGYSAEDEVEITAALPRG